MGEPIDNLGRRRRLGDMLPSIVHSVKRQGLQRIEDVDEAERANLRADIAANLHAELVAARRDTRSTRYPINCKIGEDDVDFARRWLAWITYRRDAEQWRLVPEHAAAEAAREAAGDTSTLLLSQPILDILATRPKEVERVTLHDAPPDWPLQILLWQDALATIIGARWQRARPAHAEPEPEVAREPGSDDDREPEVPRADA